MLIVSGADVRTALEGAGLGDYTEPVDVVDGDLGSGFALVRPDGILATSGSRTDGHRVLDYLRRLCGDGEPAPAAAGVVSDTAAS